MIDYVYLGTATIGVFLLAMNYEEKRYEYVQLEAQDEGRKEFKNSRLNLANGLLDLEGAACLPAAAQLMPRYCDRIKQLKLAFAAEDSSEANTDYSRAVKDYLLNIPPPNSLDEYGMQIYRKIELENEKLRSLQLQCEIDILTIKINEPLPPDDIRNSTYGLFTWPFILAFAFALRITKTTIEVLDWTTSSRV